uniref:NACHT domain-containing protein n=1 Tax=Arcella intermedia TaxID=1963864 RepID=A0A6B2KWF4_9EUKA
MHGERDFLTRFIFPELQERCKKLRVHVHPVDLRWGVTSEDTANALEVCLGELDSCRPFFIGLLGNRYGWVPEKYIVPDEPRFDWIKSEPTGKSITHLEMEYGVLRDPSKARCAFYLRDSGFIHNVPANYKADFQEDNSKNAQQLTLLKDKIISKVPPEFILKDYECSWSGVVDGKPMVSGLEKFGQHVLETFWKHFQEEFPFEQTVLTPLAIDRSYHENFIESHSRLFVGRKTILQKLTDFITQNTTTPLVIVGQPGSGKTSLVSYFANNYAKTKQGDPNTLVLVHFVGAAPGSTSIRHTLSRLIQEIGNFFNFSTEKIPEDFKELQTLFSSYMEKLGADQTRKLVLILDALNQLDPTNHAHSLDWLPETFPVNVRTIVSVLPGNVYDVLTRRKREEVSVEALTQEEKSEIVKQTLWQYRKKLEADQLALLLKKEDSGKPLYLIVACEELRVFGVFEKVKEKILKMAPTVPLLFEEVLRRLETDLDKDLVIRTLSFLTCSQSGLLETELLSLLGSRKDHYPLPQSTWSRIHRSLENYLRPAGESGEGVLDFFHRQMPKAVSRMYLQDKKFFEHIHSELADYFWEKADPEQNGMWDGGSLRGLQYTVYHHIQAKQWKNLRKILCDLAFIEAKCENGMTYDLVSDYLQLSEYKSEIPDKIFEEISEYQRFVMGRAHVLVHSPFLTFSMAYSLPNESSPAKQAHYRYYQAGLESRPFLKWVNKPQTSNPCIMTLSGHDMVIRGCHVYATEKTRRIVSAADDSLLKLYDGMTGEEILTLRGHKSSVAYCSFSPDGTMIGSGGYDKLFILWDSATGLVKHQLEGFKGTVTGCSFHPTDSQRVAVACRDKMVRIYNIPALVASFEAHEKALLGCEYSPDGTLLATCSEDHKVKVWNTDSTGQWKELKVLTGHEKTVNSVSWSPDGTRLVSASEDRKVIVWEFTPSSFLIRHRLTGHKDIATCASFDPTGTRIISGSNDNLIIIWDVESGLPVSTLVGHTGSVYRAVFFKTYPKEEEFPQDPSKDQEDPQQAPKKLQPSDLTQIVSCSFDRTVKIWEWRENMKICGHEARILSVAFSPDGKKLATGARDKTGKIWDTATGNELAALVGHTSNVFGICWSPDGKLVCTASRDSTVKIWDALTGKCKCTMTNHKAAVRSCAWSPSGEHILTSSDDKTLIIWEESTGAVPAPATKTGKSEGGDINWRSRGILFGHRAEVSTCAYSSDGRRAASGSEDGVIKLWNTKKESHNFYGPRAISPMLQFGQGQD